MSERAFVGVHFPWVSDKECRLYAAQFGVSEAEFKDQIERLKAGEHHPTLTLTRRGKASVRCIHCLREMGSGWRRFSWRRLNPDSRCDPPRYPKERESSDGVW